MHCSVIGGFLIGFDEMRKYHKGKSEDGKDVFNVPIEADESGMIGRECPADECQPRYFKISTTVPDDMDEMVSNFSQMNLTCPYCGSQDNMQHFHTQSQINWIKSMMFKDVVKSFQEMLSNSLSGSSTQSRGSGISLNLSYKPGPLPNVRNYVENELKREVICDHCGYHYAIYGISFHCPLCGRGNLIHHLHNSSDTIRVLVEESERISEELGEKIGQQLIDNALEDVIGLFEAFLKQIYQYAVRKQYPKEKAEKMIKSVRGAFQRIDDAKTLFFRDLNYDLYEITSDPEIIFLNEQFLKRHVLTHNLGLIDKKYLERARSYEKEGSELAINPKDVLETLNLVEKVITNAISNFIN